MCCLNELLFHQKALNMDPILVKRSFKEGPSHKNCEKLVKSTVFEVEKNGSRFAKIKTKKQKNSQFSCVLREKILRYG